MKNLFIIIFTTIFQSITYADNKHDITISDELRNSYFCAICIPIKKESSAGINDDNNRLTEFYELKPVTVFWGSYNAAKPSLLFHPIPKGERLAEVLVVFRESKGLNPGDWYKRYRPIQKNERPSEYYMLIGERNIDESILKEILQHYSKIMQEKYPID